MNRVEVVTARVDSPTTAATLAPESPELAVLDPRVLNHSPGQERLSRT